MSENRSLTTVYTPRESGDGESRWIRLEQEKQEGETLTVAEAAAIIDSLFGIEPCDEGMGGGGDEADEENGPTEEELDAAMAEMLRRAGVCHEAEYWEAVVNVYRSHKQPGYELRSETAEVDAVTPVRASYRQDVEASGAVIELDMPYDGNLQGIPAGVNWEARGSTVNLDRPINGRLVLRYDTYYERVTLRVPTDGGKTDPLDDLTATGATGSGNESTRKRAELPSAAVAAFWGNLAASCDLEPPEQDEDANAAEIEAICAGGSGGGSGHGGGDKPKDCWAAVTHYDRCNCSKRRVHVWTEMVQVACDEPVKGSVFGDYVHCPDDDDDELMSSEYYIRRCCHAPPKPLPRCRKTYARYRGGRPIENGAEHWRNIYGPDVAMIPVLPKGGDCGEVTTEWNVPQRNCCDEYPPLEPYPDNPTTIHAPGSVELCVVGGMDPPLRWRASAGYTFDNGKNYKNDGIRCERVHAADDACDNGSVQVDDGCTKVHMSLTRDNPWTLEPALTPDDATIAPEGFVTIYAVNMRGEVQWDGGSLRLITPQGLHEATFEAPKSFCGTTRITATDACGEMATATAMSTVGHWEEISAGDGCYPPWGGMAPAWTDGWTSCYDGQVGTVYFVDGYQGYRAEVCSLSSGTYNAGCSEGYSGEPLGSCSENEAKRLRSSCGYTGVEMIGNANGESVWRCLPTEQKLAMCCHDPSCNAGVYSSWNTKVQRITRLWQWECGNE